MRGKTAWIVLGLVVFQLALLPEAEARRSGGKGSSRRHHAPARRTSVRTPAPTPARAAPQAPARSQVVRPDRSRPAAKALPRTGPIGTVSLTLEPAAKPADRRAAPRRFGFGRSPAQEAGMGFPAPRAASAQGGVCRSQYLGCLERCGTRDGDVCAADCGVRCLGCDFKRTGMTDARASSCHQ